MQVEWTLGYALAELAQGLGLYGDMDGAGTGVEGARREEVGSDRTTEVGGDGSRVEPADVVATNVEEKPDVALRTLYGECHSCSKSKGGDEKEEGGLVVGQGAMPERSSSSSWPHDGLTDCEMASVSSHGEAGRRGNKRRRTSDKEACPPTSSGSPSRCETLGTCALEGGGGGRRVRSGSGESRRNGGSEEIDIASGADDVLDELRRGDGSSSMSKKALAGHESGGRDGIADVVPNSSAGSRREELTLFDESALSGRRSSSWWSLLVESPWAIVEGLTAEAAKLTGFSLPARDKK